MGNFAKRKLIYMVVGTWGGVILTVWTFFKAKNNIRLICVYKESEVKIEMVGLGGRGGGGDSHIPLVGKSCQHVWSLINFKWAGKSHPHHNMTSLFIPMWSRVGVLHIGHITDLPVIWHKGPSWLFIPNHFVPFSRQ